MSASGAAAPQTNGVPPSSGAPTSQTLTNTQQTQSQPTQSQSTPGQTQQPQQQPHHHPHHPTTTSTPGNQANPSTAAPRPRDARTVELLLTAQGVTSFEPRVPLLLLDFAYRHTSSILSDALHLSADPYTSHAGMRPSAASGAAPVNVGDATVSANAVQLAIGSRLGFQFRGGGGAGIGGGGGGGASKDWLMELARERNKVALPRVMPSEWGVRLPGERFVMSGVSWGLKDVWAGQEGAEESSEEEDEDEMMLDGEGGGPDAMEVEDVGGDGVEGGTMGDIFGDEGMEDEEMAEA